MRIVRFNDGDDSDSDESKSSKTSQNNGQSNGKSLELEARRLLKSRQGLPVYQCQSEIFHHVSTHRVTILVGETGSGKSTQLPQALLKYDSKQRIVVSQPRRVAATSLATRVAAEAGCALGSQVGYQVRFAAQLSPQTRIRYVTDGMLLREFMIDPKLSRYTTIIVDEAHERTIVTDLVLGLLKPLLSSRPELRVIVMSATIDADRFADFFAGVSVCKLYVPGRAFPVDRFYLKAATPSVVDAAVTAVDKVNSGEPANGDILVFLPGQEEIESVAEAIRALRPPPQAPKLLALPLYAALPEKDQALAFQPAPTHRTRKVVLATNIAETSVTIPGVRYVIDSGLRKVRRHRAKLGLDSLLPTAVSQASAAQRAGRAGREAPGKCWRLYTESTYGKMIPHTEPEISRVSVSGPVLTLKCSGVKDVKTFSWIDPPSKGAVRNALLQLYSLKALDDSGQVTALGRSMSTLPLDPALSAVLVNATSEATDVDIKEAVLDVAACLSVQDLLITPPSSARQAVGDARAEQFPQASQYGDLVLLKLVWDTYQTLVRQGASKSELRDWARTVGVNFRSLLQVKQVRQQLKGYLKPIKSANLDETSDQGTADPMPVFSRYEDLINAFLTGYLTNTAIALPDRRFQTTMTGQTVSIHPGSALFGQRPAAIMYLEYVYTTREYARIVSPIDIETLRMRAPHLLDRQQTHEV